MAVERGVRGEAVAVDLPGDKTLFALLRSDNTVEWASNVVQTLALHVAHRDGQETHASVIARSFFSTLLRSGSEPRQAGGTIGRVPR
jgi:hypothetical protein